MTKIPSHITLHFFLYLKNHSTMAYALVVERGEGLLSISNPIKLQNISNPFVLIWQGAVRCSWFAALYFSRRQARAQT